MSEQKEELHEVTTEVPDPKERLKIFIDTAKVEEIRIANSWGVLHAGDR